MKTKHLFTAIGALALSVALSAPAHAAMIAGWDFSQYFASGELSIDAATYTNVLSANYSNLDPTFGAGAESSAFGTLYYNGQFGSTDVDPSSASAALTPLSGSLASNINAPVPPTGTGSVPFDSFTVLANEGQAFQNELSLKTASTVSFVFAAYLTTVPGLGADWSLTFGGLTGGGTSTISIDFSNDGQTYISLGQSILNTIDTKFSFSSASIPGGVGSADQAFFRFNVTPTGTDTRIDNVAINGSVVVPEPGTMILLGSALALAGLFGRRRA
jgi:hypothetical protein